MARNNPLTLRTLFRPRVALSPGFVDEYVRIYMSQKTYADEATLEGALKSALVRQDYITKAQLLGLGKWKAPRILRLIERNSPDTVREISHQAFNSENERDEVTKLLRLDGVGWPMASVIWHFYRPDDYSVLDFRALWSLGFNKTPPYNFWFWREYHSYIKSESVHVGKSIRHLDMALWAFSKTHQKPHKTILQNSPQA